MCRNGRYRERGIKELDGYGAELVTLEREYAVKLEPSLESVGVLTEPTSVVAKAWEQIDRVGVNGCRPLETVLVTGAGPVGLLAAWAMRDVLGRRQGREDESDLLGVLAIAALLVLLPLASEEAGGVAGLVGGAIGIVLGLLLARLPER